MRDLHLVLVYPDIHWNTGNTGRSCLAFDAALHLVEPLGFSLADREVRRAGLDYWPHVDLHVHPNWETFEAQIETLGSPWFLSAEATTPLSEAPLTSPAVLVLGSETEGLPQALRERYAPQMLRIPQQTGTVRSLNQSTAAALAMYEFRRRFPTG